MHVDWQSQLVCELDLLLEYFTLYFPQPLLLFTVNFADHVRAEVQPNLPYCYQLGCMLADEGKHWDYF